MLFSKWQCNKRCVSVMFWTDSGKKIASGEWKFSQDETILVDEVEFENLIKEIKRKFGEGFTKRASSDARRRVCKSSYRQYGTTDVFEENK